VIIVICVICVVIFVFHKGFLKKKENNEKKEKIIEENVDDNIKGNKVENSLKEDEESD
jgi:cbb3-type cytochrome oxidase subunit 3